MIENGIFSYLSAQASIVALIGPSPIRLYPDLLPENIKPGDYPAVTFFRVDTPRLYGIQGPQGFAQPRFQFSVFGNTKASVLAVAQALRLALDGFEGLMGDTVVREIAGMSERDQYESTTRSYHRILDFQISHEE